VTEHIALTIDVIEGVPFCGRTTNGLAPAEAEPRGNLPDLSLLASNNHTFLNVFSSLPRDRPIRLHIVM
jgi:hypothetical protein